jgi:hypothetical protein
MGSKLTKQKKNSISAINQNQITNSINNLNESILTSNSINQYELTNSANNEEGLLNLDELNKIKLNKANQETDDASIREKSSLSSSDEHYVFSDIMAKADEHPAPNVNMKKEASTNENEKNSTKKGECVFVKPLTSILVNTSTQNVPKIPNSIRGRAISVPNKYSNSSSQSNNDECKAKSKGVRFSEHVKVIHDDFIISNVMSENSLTNKLEKNSQTSENSRRVLMSNGKEFDRFKSWNFFKESTFLVMEKKSIKT